MTFLLVLLQISENARKPLQDGSAKRQKQRQAELAMASDF